MKAVKRILMSTWKKTNVACGGCNTPHETDGQCYKKPLYNIEDFGITNDIFQPNI